MSKKRRGKIGRALNQVCRLILLMGKTSLCHSGLLVFVKQMHVHGRGFVLSFVSPSFTLNGKTNRTRILVSADQLNSAKRVRRTGKGRKFGNPPYVFGFELRPHESEPSHIFSFSSAVFRIIKSSACYFSHSNSRHLMPQSKEYLGVVSSIEVVSSYSSQKQLVVSQYLGRAGSMQEQLGGTRSNQEQLVIVRRSQEQFGTARSSQQYEGGVRSSQEDQGVVKSSQEVLGLIRSSY